MYTPNDMYGDLSQEDVEEFEGLQPDDEREISPRGLFQRDEFRSFERDFSYDLDSDFDEDGNEIDVGEVEDEFAEMDEMLTSPSEYVREAE